jgi:rRNA processing protein Krr1/Pno1
LGEKGKSMVDIIGQKRRLEQAKEEYKHATGFHRKDIGKFINRLQKELRECEAHKYGTYGVKR